MKQIRKKLLLLGLLACMGSVLFTGCGKQEKTETTAAQEKTEKEVEKEEQEEEQKEKVVEETKITEPEETDKTEEAEEEKPPLTVVEHPKFLSEGIRSLVLTSEGEEIFRITREPADYKMEFDYWEILNPYNEIATVNTETMYTLFDTLSQFDFTIPAETEEGTDPGVAGSTTVMQIDFVNTTDGETAKKTEDPDSTMRLLVGNEDDLGNRYVAVEGYEDTVYKVSSSILDAVYTLNPFDYILKIPALVNIDTVERVELSAEDTDCTMEIKDGKYQIGGKEVEKGSFTSLYQALMNVMLYAEVETPVADSERQELLTIVFHRNTEQAPEITIRYFTYDDNYDSVEINGAERFLVKEEEVTALIQQIQEAAK
ncbi:MAG: hypothetical protein ACI4EO_08270 [Blautia sp.]